MKKTVTVDGEQHDVEVCDKCATAPKGDLIPLYRDLERHVHGPHTGPESVEYGSRLIRQRNKFDQIVHAHKFKFGPGSVVVEELRDDDPDVEICEGCFGEVLSWGDEQ